MAFKIHELAVGFLPPVISLPTTGSEVYKVGEALKLASGALTKAGATDAAEYISEEEYTAPSSGQRALRVHAVRPDIIYETVCSDVYGLEVTAQSPAAMAVNVAGGIVYMGDGTFFRLDPKALTVEAADNTNPRKDIVYVSATGVISIAKGTAAGSPSAPGLPTGGVLLAEISVVAQATSLTGDKITAKATTSANVAIGDVVTIHGSGLMLTGTESSGVATILAKTDDPLRGTVVHCVFK